LADPTSFSGKWQSKSELWFADSSAASRLVKCA
jgi:hypothetical protein